MAPTKTDNENLHRGLVFPSVAELADPELLVEFAVAADEAGWDGIFLYDHLIWPFTSDPDEYQATVDPWITLAGIATRTDHITLGTWITPVPRRQPWQLANNLATLDHLSNGRVMLGAGLGTRPDFTRFGRAYDQQRLGEQFDEALDVIAGLWSGDTFSYDGERYTIDDAVMLPTPVQQPRIPIVIGGWWPFKASFHRGARWDGIAPNWPAMLQGLPDEELDEWPDHIQDAVAQQRSHEEELQEMVEYYRTVADGSGEIVLYESSSTPPDFVDLCRNLGATWILSSSVDGSATPSENVERIREGPPD